MNSRRSFLISAAALAVFPSLPTTGNAPETTFRRHLRESHIDVVKIWLGDKLVWEKVDV